MDFSPAETQDSKFIGRVILSLPVSFSPVFEINVFTPSCVGKLIVVRWTDAESHARCFSTIDVPGTHFQAPFPSPKFMAFSLILQSRGQYGVPVRGQVTNSLWAMSGLRCTLFCLGSP